MKTLLFKAIAVALTFWLLPCSTSAQQIIELNYEAKSNTLDLTNVPKKVKHNTKYTLIVKNINTAHVVPFSEVTSSRFVSGIPDILRSIYIGIPDDAVGMNLPQDIPARSGIYSKATQYYHFLENIQRISNDLYLQTRFNPNNEIAQAKKQELLQVLGVRSIQEAYAKAVMAHKYIPSVLEVYSAQLPNINADNENTLAFIEEYATIKGYNENLKNIDFAFLLNFIEESQQASSTLPLASFTATGDVVDVAVQLVNSYTNSTLLEQTLSFAVYDNFSFDFSTGFFYNNLVEPEYYLDPNENGRLDIKEENKSNTDISIGALGHFTYKFLPEWRGGVALGAAISPLDGKLRYLLGPTLLWGGQKQVSLTFGLALAQMDKLSDVVINDDLGQYLPADIGSIATTHSLKSGFFIGLTYNLTNRKQP